jgi:hypothetical protein
MGFALAANPAQDEVNRRNELHLHRVRIEGVFASRERSAPDSALTDLHLLAVTERFAGDVGSGGAMIGNNHTHIADGYEGLGLDLDRAEPAVDKERAVSQYL